MPKSGSTATPARKRKPKKNIANFPGLVLDASPSSSPTPSPSNETALLAPAEARVERALNKFNISRATWERSPEITPIIWRTIGNQLKAMETLRFSEDEQVRRLLDIYEDMSRDDRERLPLEIPCLAAKVSPWHILGQIVMAAKDLSRMESALILIGQNPEILKATAAFGTALPSNVKDREMMLKATGTLPSPKGMSINIFPGQEKEEQFEEVDAEESDLPLDVFAYDAKVIDGWGDQRRRLMDEDKRK
jgi:hypothetical protein